VPALRKETSTGKYSKNLGHWGESVAAEYLLERGYLLLERNARTPYGELDLVMSKGEVFVFIEVKTRTSQRYGYPEESVTSAKKQHLLAAVQAYLLNHPEIVGDIRIDVIAIQRMKGDPTPKIVHYENAVIG